MTQPDQIDQLLLQAPPVANNSLLADVQPADKKMKEKIVQVVASGKSRRYVGKALTTKEIEELNGEEIQKTLR